MAFLLGNTEQRIDDLTGDCPSCEGSWKGCKMTDEQRVFFAAPDQVLPKGSHFSLLIGRENPRVYDGVCAWVCPHCQVEFPRHDLYGPLLNEG
jgi:hypothetical protein